MIKTKKIATYRKSITTLFLSALLAFAVSSPVAANDCGAACEAYVKCTVEHFQSQGRNVSDSERNQLNAGCMNACNQHAQKINQCYQSYTSQGNSCIAYWQCIQSVMQ